MFAVLSTFIFKKMKKTKTTQQTLIFSHAAVTFVKEKKKKGERQW